MVDTSAKFSSQSCLSGLWCRSLLQAGSQRKPGEFGSPERRVTDVLLVLNAVVYIAQLATKQRLTAWGIKAIIPPAHLPAVDCLHLVNMRVTLRPLNFATTIPFKLGR